MNSKEGAIEKERIKRYLNIAGNIILSLDPKGRIVFLNKEGHRILGYKNGELIGKNWFDECLPKDRESRMVFVQCMKSRGAKKKHEGYVLTKSGEKRYMRWRSDSIKDVKGNVIEILCSGEDITEEKKAWKEHKESEKRFKNIFDNLPFIAFTLDSRGRLVDANKQAEKITGLKVRDFKGRRFSEFGLLGKRDVIRIYMEFRKTLKGKVTGKTMYKIKTKTGERLLELVGIRLIENGKVKGVLLVGSDVTEHKKTEKALEEERKQLMSIFDSIDEMIYVSDPKTYEILYVNPMIKRLLKRDVIGELCYKAFHNRDSPCEFCTNDIILKNKGKPYKWRHHNDIVNREYLITDRIIKWPDGRDVRFEFAVDITEQSMMREVLKESEEKFRVIAESARDAIAMIDNEGNTYYWNGAAEEMFGYKKEEILGKPLHDIIAPEKYRESYEKGLSVFKKEGRGNAIGKILELSGLRKDRKEFPIELSLSAVKFKGKWYAVAIIRDITKRKQMEEEIIKSKKELERKIYELERFSKLSVGRELKMIELKKKIRELERRLQNSGG